MIGLPRLDLTQQLLALSGGIEGKWLDAGCGAGETLRLLEKLGVAAVGIDKRPQAPDIIASDMCALSFENETFDNVIAECSLSVCGDALKALEEFFRVLKPGGKLYITDIYVGESSVEDLSLGRVATFENWCALLAECGFKIQASKCILEAWKEYMAKLMRGDAKLQDVRLDDGSVALGESGYFILYAVKQS